MTLDELRAKLKALEETRKIAKEFALLEDRRERLETMERNKLLKSYAALTPEHLSALGPEERRTVYPMLELTVEVLPDRSLKVSGAFGEETPVWETVGTSDVSPLKQTFLRVKPSDSL
jgi:hypothetical protein